jgi:hypothetical protein
MKNKMKLDSFHTATRDPAKANVVLDADVYDMQSKQLVLMRIA